VRSSGRELYVRLEKKRDGVGLPLLFTNFTNNTTNNQKKPQSHWEKKVQYQLLTEGEEKKKKPIVKKGPTDWWKIVTATTKTLSDMSKLTDC
jgi:hypothetical protein